MCIIIDNCLVMDLKNDQKHMEPIKKYLEKGGIVVLSDELYREYPASFQAAVVELQRRNQVRKVKAPALGNDVRKLITSNDHHVISLVLGAAVEVVCTTDDDLTNDLKNPKIIKKPRCKVYRHARAKRVLSGCCP